MVRDILALAQKNKRVEKNTFGGESDRIYRIVYIGMWYMSAKKVKSKITKTTCIPPKHPPPKKIASKTLLNYPPAPPKKKKTETSIRHFIINLTPHHHPSHHVSGVPYPGGRSSALRTVAACALGLLEPQPWNDKTLVLCPVGAVSVILRGEDVVAYLYMIYKVQSGTQYDVYMFLYTLAFC